MYGISSFLHFASAHLTEGALNETVLFTDSVHAVSLCLAAL